MSFFNQRLKAASHYTSGYNSLLVGINESQVESIFFVTNSKKRIASKNLHKQDLFGIFYADPFVNLHTVAFLNSSHVDLLCVKSF